MDEVSEYKGFVFFPSIRQSIEALSAKQGKELLWAVMIYGTEKNIIPCTKGVRAVLLSIIPNIDSQEIRYNKRAKKSVEAKAQPPTLPKETDIPFSDNDTDDFDENVMVAGKRVRDYFND